MSLSISSGFTQSVTSVQFPKHYDVEDLYPQEIIDAVGGVDAFTTLPKSEQTPTYGPNIDNCRSSFIDGKRVYHTEPPEGPIITQGLDLSGRPFLEVFVPDFDPVVFYPYSNCKTKADFTDLGNWKVDTRFSARSFKKNDLALTLLSQIVKNEGCVSTMKNVRYY